MRQRVPAATGAMIIGTIRMLTRPRVSFESPESIIATTTPMSSSSETDTAAKSTLLRRLSIVSSSVKMFR